MGGIVNSSQTTVMVLVSGNVYPLPPDGRMGGEDNFSGEDGASDVDGFWVNGTFHSIPGVVFDPTTKACVGPSQTVLNAGSETPKERGFSTNAPPKDGDTKPLTKPPGKSSYAPVSEFLSNPDQEF